MKTEEKIEEASDKNECGCWSKPKHPIFITIHDSHHETDKKANKAKQGNENMHRYHDRR